MSPVVSVGLEFRVDPTTGVRPNGQHYRDENDDQTTRTPGERTSEVTDHEDTSQSKQRGKVDRKQVPNSDTNVEEKTMSNTEFVID